MEGGKSERYFSATTTTTPNSVWKRSERSTRKRSSKNNKEMATGAADGKRSNEGASASSEALLAHGWSETVESDVPPAYGLVAGAVREALREIEGLRARLEAVGAGLAGAEAGWEAHRWASAAARFQEAKALFRIEATAASFERVRGALGLAAAHSEAVSEQVSGERGAQP